MSGQLFHIAGLAVCGEVGRRGTEHQALCAEVAVTEGFRPDIRTAYAHQDIDALADGVDEVVAEGDMWHEQRVAPGEVEHHR